MVARALHKKLYRTIRTQWGQSLAIIAVVACGVASYITFYSCYLDLQLTRDTYYQQQRYADFELVLDRAPRSVLYRIAEMDGVRRVRGRIVQDVSIDLEGVREPRTGRIVSMPAPRREVLNDIVVTRGNHFESGAMEEVILSERFAEANGLDIGDRIDVNIESRRYSLRIVGFGLSPEYIYMIRNVQELVPSPDRFGILWVPEALAESALNLEAAYNNIIGYADDPENLDPLFDRFDDELEPYGIFAKMDRDNMISHRFVEDEIQGLGVTAQVMPTIFLGVAAMILFVLLNRMVRMERTQIGLLKAYGYTNAAVALHYIQYGLILCGIGGFVGFLLGQWLAGLMIQVYIYYYQFPILVSRIYPEAVIRSMGITATFALVGALWSAARAAAIQPAEAMRAEAPASAHKTVLEHLPGVWRRISFTWKMILRNLERNRLRAAISVAGVALSTALLIMGYTMQDAMTHMLDFQFREVQREDVRVAFQRQHGRDTFHDMARFEEVRRAEPVLEYPFTLRAGWRKKDAVITGLAPGGELKRLVNTAGDVVEIGGDGVVLSDLLAKELGVGPGDALDIEPLMGRVKNKRTVTVSKVAQQYLGWGAYMDIHALSRLLDESFAMNAVLLRTVEGSDEALNERLKEIADVASVGFARQSLQSLHDTIGQNMAVMNIVMLLFAGVIALALIYNVTAVALAERQRELASLRVLGLSAGEVGRIMYYENFLLGFFGIVAGLPFGYWLTKWILGLFETDLYRFPFFADSRTYVLCALITVVFVVLANGAVWRTVQRLDLIEVLKERE